MAEQGWRESDVFTPLERDVLEYAEAMTHTPPTVTDELSARLLAALGAPALVELAAYICPGEPPTPAPTPPSASSRKDSQRRASCGRSPSRAAPGAHRRESRCVGRARAPSVAG